MRKILAVLALAGGAALSGGCYHATIETGATPSTTVVEKGFASGWIYGLVPPSTLSTASQCTNGVAKVETQMSFVNGLVAFLTFEIYTPMNIKVTCAANRMGEIGGGTEHVAAAATPAEYQAAFAKAADDAARSGEASYVVIDR